MARQHSVAIAESRPAYVHIIFTVLAVGLGVTVPKIFHVFGLGPAFLPMFLPVILLATFSTYRYVLFAAIITPFLSYGLTGMPPAPVALQMVFQLVALGALLVYFTRRLNMQYLYAIPAAIISERLLSLIAALSGVSQHLSVSQIVGSYPGMIMLAVVPIIVLRLYER